MKKIKFLVVFLFAALVVSGCSCTKSMCSSEDKENIKISIREKWENDSEYRVKLEEEAMHKDITDPVAVENYINEKIEKKIEDEYNSHPKACLTTEDMVDPDSGAVISGKSWGSAFKKGLLEGLIVFPISWLFITFTSLFGGSGAGKILAIVVTTIIIKSLMLLFTFKQQIQTQKMQEIQPELNEISRKLSDQTLSQNERYRLQMKMMEVYKKYNINPFSSLLPTLISFPIFMSVWSAVSETLVIRTGTFLGIELGKAISSQVFGFNIGAIILFLLMAGLQIFQMKLPLLLRKKQANYKKPNNDDANKQMNTMMNVMMVIIIFTGFMLPAAIAVYWTVGAIFAILQTLIFQSSKIKEKLSRLGNRKKKAKVVQ